MLCQINCKNIEDGRDIKLAALMIPNYEDLESKSTKDKFRDPRLSKRLTIEQFRVAFGMYRRIICRKFPLSFITGVINRHSQNPCTRIRTGAKFYDYHLAFSRKAAGAIKL